MELSTFQQKIIDMLPGIDFRLWEPLSDHTSFRIGGPAEVMAFPKTADELAGLFYVSKLLDCNCLILGAGTNVLASDDGISGLVICLKDCLGGMEVLEDNRLRVAAGVTMTRAATFAATKGLSGMEFAHGIPGTVGGGIFMNAGAYGGEMADICESVDVMWPDGKVETLSSEQMSFSYRHSRLEVEPGTVICVVFRLEPKPESEIRGRMQELLAKRKASQPLDLPSAGSAFKRPVGGYAAALIDQAGLKGFRIGGAAISEKHAGFAVNLGGATAKDVQMLLSQVSDKVYEFSGIRLEPEVRIW